MNIYDHCMADIETLSTESSAVVLSLGAVAFNLTDDDNEVTLKESFRGFYIPFDIQEQLAEGRILDAATLKWWMKQEKNARAVFHEKTSSVLMALADFSRFCKSHEIKYIWGNGNTFDNMTLRSLYKSFNFTEGYPVDFRSDMDLRTYRLAAGSPAYEHMNIARIGTHHNALDDAKHQVLQAQLYNRIITG